jgi:enoyl-CoA hydratase/carnithine racemase
MRADTATIAIVTQSTDTPGTRVDIDGPLARFTLDRPAQHNALSAADVDLFRAQLDEVERNDAVRVIVVTGSGDATFCSGASLAQMESGEMSGAVFETLTNRLSDVRLPTICALNGSVYGGGAEIALCCDFRIGVTGSRLAVPAARLGVCYPVGGLRRYVERLGLATASRILLAAEELDSDEMLRVGFLTHRVARGDLVAETDALASRLSALAPLAVQSMKRILTDVAAGTADAKEAARLVELCDSSADLKEGLRARREGREPRFEGR